VVSSSPTSERFPGTPNSRDGASIRTGMSGGGSTGPGPRGGGGGEIRGVSARGTEVVVLGVGEEIKLCGEKHLPRGGSTSTSTSTSASHSGSGSLGIDETNPLRKARGEEPLPTPDSSSLVNIYTNNDTNTPSIELSSHD